MPRSASTRRLSLEVARDLFLEGRFFIRMSLACIVSRRSTLTGLLQQFLAGFDVHESVLAVRSSKLEKHLPAS